MYIPTIKRAIKSLICGLFIFTMLSGCSSQNDETEKGEKVVHHGENKGEGPMSSEFNEKNPDLNNQFLDSQLILMKKDGKINLNFTMKNRTENAINLTFSSSKQYDFFVYNETNELVYQWSKGRSFAMVMKDVVFDAGQTISFKESWEFVNQEGKKLPDGKYIVEFRVAANAKTLDGKEVDGDELMESSKIETTVY